MCEDEKVMLAFLVGKISERKLSLFHEACRFPGISPAFALREIGGNPFRSVALPEGPSVQCPLCKGEKTQRVRPVGASHTRKTHLVNCQSCRGKGIVPGSCPWKTPTVLALARAAYDDRPGRKCERCGGRGATLIDLHKHKRCPDCAGSGRIEDGSLDNDRLAVLSDGLEEAGADSEELLLHLRSPGPHVRGCWAVDLILGKD